MMLVYCNILVIFIPFQRYNKKLDTMFLKEKAVILAGILCYLTTLTFAKRVFTDEERETAINAGINPDDLSEDTVFLTPAKLNDEERGSKFMPSAYKCDGCHAVAYQVRNH